MKALRLIALTAAAGIALAGCSSTEDEPVGATTPTSGVGTPPPDTIEYFNQVVGDRVFFGTDRHDLDGGAQQTLAQQAQWLTTYGGTTVTIEGHADERGTRAYNLALGARRADSVYRFLVSQGVGSGRLKTVTFGKERPVARCSDESCWSQNRRAVSVVAGAPSS